MNFFENERLLDAPARSAHTHSVHRCDYHIAGGEIGWLCGELPMFSQLAPEPFAPACPRCGRPMLADSLSPADELDLTDDGILVHLACSVEARAAEAGVKLELDR